MNICSNGFLSFTSTTTTYTNGNIPDPTAPNDILALFWDDMNPSAAGNIYHYYDSANDRFIVEYNGVPHWNTTSYNTAQVILYSSGKIVYQYQTVGSSTVNTATVGIENSDGSDASLVIKDAAYLKDNLAIQFQATPEWLSLDTTSGTISGNSSLQIAATCDASELELGVYTADMVVTTNDPDEPTTIIPVTFTVTNIVAPEVPANIVTSISGLDLVVDWDVSANATSYDVYSSDDPYGTFTLVTNVGTNQYTVPADQAKLFYYIVAKN